MLFRSAVNNAVNQLKSVNDFFNNLISFFSNPIRLIKMLIGFTLIIVGLVLMIKELTPQPVKKAAKDIGIIGGK